MIGVDLHTHSTASDGRWSPTQVIRRGAERGLSAIALTDHDTFLGLDEALAAAEGIRVIPGVELSTHHRGRGLHLLAYFRAPGAWGDDFPRLLAQRHVGRRERLHRIGAALQRLGVPLDVDAVEAVHGSITRAHVARQLVHQGAVASMQEAFDRYLGDDRPAFVASERWETPAAIRFVREQGGLCSLAHPGVDEVGGPELAELAKAGLMGVECWHPRHGRQTRKRLRKAARELGMVATGGSDCHGQPGADLLGATEGDGLPDGVGAAFLEALDRL